MILKKEQIASISSRISFLEEELSDFIKSNKIDWKTYLNDKKERRNLERLIENLVNSLIDISKIFLAGQEAGEIPNSYSDVMLKLGQLKIVDDETAQKLVDFTKLRNVLAHQYLDLRWDKINKFIKEAPEIIRTFLKSIGKDL